MAATRGSVITLKIDATLFQGLVSKNFSGQINAEDATNQDSGGWKTSNAGDSNWSVGFENMLDPTHTKGVQAVLEAWKDKDDVVVLIEGAVAGEPTITGTGRIDQIELQMDHGQTSRCRGTIIGKGAVTIGTVSA